MRHILFVILLIYLTFTTDIKEKLSAPVQDGDLAFLRALNNYFGCKTWVDGQCAQCSANYIFNDNKICSQVTPQCKKFNRAIGICQECYLGYQIFNGQCILKKLAESIDRGCKSFQNGKCKQCSIRWYFDENKNCQPVDDNCRKWSEDGKCSGCYMGYSLEGSTCQLSKRGKVSNIDTYCSEWENLSCIKCAQRAYFGPIGLCIPVSDYCRTWDRFDGFCLTCYKGYSLIQGNCEVSEINKQPPSDIGCKDWDWQNQICLRCSERWVFDSEGACVAVSDDCRHYNQEGQCVQCYLGYEIQEGKCVYSKKNTERPNDIGCKLWDWQNLKCLECSQRWTFDENKKCKPVSDQCKGYNKNGQCTECYRGYDLVKGVCQLSPLNNIQPQDPGCKIWDWQGMICIQCSFRWYLGGSERCIQVSEQCKNHDENGRCTQCYKGYEVQRGECVESETDYCAERLVSGECKECYLGYRLLRDRCVPSNPLCETSNQEGQCLSCFSTYVLYKNICVPLVKLVNLAQYYAQCCPQKLEQLKRQGRIV